MAEGSPGGMDAVRDPYERHRWITTMEEFAEFLTAAERQALPPLVLKHPVNVAVIDDGVDINDQTIQSRIAGGRSFCHRDESENLNQPYYVSSGGHGTAMAGLICKVCPNVRLYILKLNEYYLEPGKRQITAKSAARVSHRNLLFIVRYTCACLHSYHADNLGRPSEPQSTERSTLFPCLGLLRRPRATKTT